MDINSKVYVAGHQGLVGSAITRELTRLGYKNVITKTRKELNLLDQAKTKDFFETNKVDVVFLAAAKVGGIQANNIYRGDFIRENLLIQDNVINAAFNAGVKNLLFLGSSCVYPKACPQPIKESYLLSGPLESTNEAYAVAKIAGLMLCKSLSLQYGVKYISAMPTNMYGPRDNYHPTNSHVLPALIKRFHEAKQNKASHVTVWGSGNPRREFLYSDDLANAAIHCMIHYKDTSEAINVGYGSDVSIKELAELVSEVVGFGGSVEWDSSKPDGTHQKLLDTTKLNSLGWKPSIDLKQGITLAYNDFLAGDIREA